jgi:hypothetical protein
LRRLLAVDHQHLADVLDRVSASALADAGERHFARVAVERRRAHLDQLVVRERAVDLGDHRVAEALLPQLQDGMQGMGACPEGFALGRRGGCRSAHVSGRATRQDSAAGESAALILGCLTLRAR